MPQFPLIDTLYPLRYRICRMFTFIQSSTFGKWLGKLNDSKAKAVILVRLTQAQGGKFGDCAPVGHGVSEMRIHYGPGYRLYYIQSGKAIYVLLCGGNKSAQARDIKKAQKMAGELRRTKR